MTKEQLRHAQSIARHILVHVQQIERDMKVIQSMSFSDVSQLSISNLKNRFTKELDHNIKEINQVITDMLPDLEAK